MPYIQNSLYRDRAVLANKSSNFTIIKKTALDWVEVQRPFTKQQKTNWEHR